MKKFLIILCLFALTLPLHAAQISVPSAPSAGYALVSTSTGAYVATTTSPFHLGAIYASSTIGSFFNGNVGIGSTSPTARLSIPLSTGTNDTLLIGSALSPSLKIDYRGQTFIGTSTNLGMGFNGTSSLTIFGDQQRDGFYPALELMGNGSFTNDPTFNIVFGDYGILNSDKSFAQISSTWVTGAHTAARGALKFYTLSTGDAAPINWLTMGTGGNHYLTTTSGSRAGFASTTPFSTLSVDGTVGMNLGSDATGDIHYRNSSGQLSRLAIGGSNTLLHGGTTPSYSALSTSDLPGGGYPVDMTVGGMQINQAANATTVMNAFLPTANAAFSVNLLTATLKVSGAGCVVGGWVTANAAVTAGRVALKAAVNGTVNNTPIATLSTTNTPNYSGTLPCSTITFSSGDTISLYLASDSAYLPVTNDYSAAIIVRYTN